MKKKISKNQFYEKDEESNIKLQYVLTDDSEKSKRHCDEKIKTRYCNIIKEIRFHIKKEQIEGIKYWSFPFRRIISDINE